MTTYSPTVEEFTVLAKHWASRRLMSLFRAFVNRSAAGADLGTAQRHLDVLERALGPNSMAPIVAKVEGSLRAEVGEVVWTMFQTHLKREPKQSVELPPDAPPERQIQPDWNELRRHFEGPFFDTYE